MNETTYLQLSFYSQPVLIVLGTIGALLNQILFRREKSLRSASCSLYFRALSINDLLVLYFVVLTQWLNDQFGIDPMNKHPWYCKIRTYSIYFLYAISPYFIVLGCFDRLCRSSRNIRWRRIATLSVARQMIPILVVLILLIYVHIPFQFDLIQSICMPLNAAYFQFLGYFLLIFYCLLPPILMSIFCTCTCLFLNHHRDKQRMRGVLRVSSVHSYRRYQDYQLIKLLFLYVATNIICTLPFTVVFLLNVYHYGSAPKLAILIKCTVLLANVNYCTSFYVYTLSTPMYRRELGRMMSDFRR